MDTLVLGHVGSRATPATRASNMMEILKARRKQKDVPVHPAVLDNVGSRATPATPAISPMGMLKAMHKQDLDPPALPAGAPQEALMVTVGHGLPPEQPATVEVLNTVTDAVSTSPGLSVRLCMGCGNPFTPSDDNKVYCRAKCWNTLRVVMKPSG